MVISLYSLKIKVKFIKGVFMKFSNNSKGGCIDKGYPKNIHIFKGEKAKGEISVLMGE